MEEKLRLVVDPHDYTGFCTFQVVQDFSHQQYVVILCLQMELSETNGDTPKALFNKLNGFFTHFP